MWSLTERAGTFRASTRQTCRKASSRIAHSRCINNVNKTTETQATAVSQPSVASYDFVWNSFATRVQGEWEGVTVTFNSSGAPQPLPDRFVPGAYREWGVELFDWQSQSSCVIHQGPEGAPSLRNIFKRLMPTVGCEADAIAYVEEAEDVWKADGGSPVKPVTPAGSYLAAPAQLPQSGGRVKVEACLAAPDGQSRLRATLTLMQHWESKEWQVVFVDLSRETYDGPFNGGVELSGCAGGGKPFAKDPSLTAQELVGEWQAASVLRYACSAETGSMELLPSSQQSAPRLSTEGALLLPTGTWVSCKAGKSNAEIVIGRLLGSGVREVASCKYAGGRLEEMVFSSETKSSA